jgi:hypothetical protein
MMQFLKTLIRKFKSAFQILAPLPLLFFRYCLYVLSSHKLCSRSLHEFSLLWVIPSHFKKLSGMTNDTERAYFRWYAQGIYTGSGAIVDLGSWLGSTTISLAMGLMKNLNLPSTIGGIHAYDEFIWRDYMEGGVKGTSLQGKLQVGESFFQEFNKRIAPWRNQIVVHPTDLSQVKWEGGIIEFLLIDAMKSWELTNNIMKTFFPALNPGVSLILHQDFAHWFTPWIHLTNYRLRDYFEYVYEVPRSGSLVFKLVRAIPPELLNSTLSFSSFSRNEVEAAFSHSFGLVSEEKRPKIAAAKVMVFLHMGDLKVARQELEKCRIAGLTFDSDLSIVEKRLFKEEWGKQPIS